MQLNQASIINRKKYILLVFSVLVFIVNVNSIDSDFVDSPFMEFDICQFEDISNHFGKPLLYNIFSDGSGEYRFFFYEGIRFIAYDNYNDNNYIFSAVISSPLIKIKKDIFVGLQKHDIIKKLGTPDILNNDSIIYRGDSHYIIFYCDKFNQIISISWLYYLD